MVPNSWRRQLAGTMPEQLAHLRIEVERIAEIAALKLEALPVADKRVLVVLRKAGNLLTASGVANAAGTGFSPTQAALDRLLRRGLVRNVPQPKGKRTLLTWAAL